LYCNNSAHELPGSETTVHFVTGSVSKASIKRHSKLASVLR